jgi:hypothetical protein
LPSQLLISTVSCRGSRIGLNMDLANPATSRACIMSWMDCCRGSVGGVSTTRTWSVTSGARSVCADRVVPDITTDRAAIAIF